MTERTCTHDGCEDQSHAKGLCPRHYSNAWYHANSEAARATQADYRADRRESERERAQAWREANPERAAEARRRWYRANAERVREQKRRYREANRDRIRASNNRRKAMHRNAPVNDLTGDEWTAIKAAYRQRCAYCGAKPRRLTMDHVIPLARGGAHTAANIVPACQPCNSRKSVGPAPPFQPLLL